MRNFEERKAEVFRRSEKRIKERKRNRIRILAMCIPLCFVLTIFSVTMLPQFLPKNMDGAENETIGNVYDEMEGADGKENAGGSSLVHNFVFVDVRGIGSQLHHHSSVSDTSKINDVFEQIYTILTPYESYNEIVGNLLESEADDSLKDGEKGESADTSNNIKASGYVVTMSTSNGITRTFTLTENKLYDAQFNIEVELSNEQIHNLKSALGLTD